jgi:hypothetical protein
METEGQRLIFKNKLKEAIEVLETFALLHTGHPVAMFCSPSRILNKAEWSRIRSIT